jgi:hypothetical protein
MLSVLADVSAEQSSVYGKKIVTSARKRHMMCRIDEDQYYMDSLPVIGWLICTGLYS